jgi:hypothetical protein
MRVSAGFSVTGLSGENLDPNLTAALGVAGQGRYGGLDLLAGVIQLVSEATRPVLAVGNEVAAVGRTLHATAENAAMLDSLGINIAYLPPSTAAAAWGFLGLQALAFCTPKP